MVKKSQYHLIGRFCCAIALFTSFTVDAIEENDFSAGSDFIATLSPVSDEELADLRGGFVLPNGINIDFSIEKIVAINGVVTFASTFDLPENISLAQNGLGNVAPELTGPILGSVVQNNLDDQMISTLNTINIALSNIKNAFSSVDRAAFLSELAVPNFSR